MNEKNDSKPTKKTKGIILAGGMGTRLYPNTIAVSKQLLPVYDKPLIYYPLSVLLLARISDILVITTRQNQAAYKHLLGDGSKIGINIQYEIQDRPGGLAEAFILGEEFIGDDNVCLVLGDNVLYGDSLSRLLCSTKKKIEMDGGAAIFGYPVKNPEAFGVVKFDKNTRIVKSIEEKPEEPKSNYAVLGLYFYDNRAVEIAKAVEPSARGEKEITSVNNAYLEKGELSVSLLGRGMTWFDTGTPKNMYKAGGFVKTVQEMQGYYISCIEEIAWRKGFIDDETLEVRGRELGSTEYGQYILSLLEEKKK